MLLSGVVVGRSITPPPCSAMRVLATRRGLAPKRAAATTLSLVLVQCAMCMLLAWLRGAGGARDRVRVLLVPAEAELRSRAAAGVERIASAEGQGSHAE